MKIKRVKHFKYLRSVLAKCDTELRMIIEIDACLKLCKLISNRKEFFLETKKRFLGLLNNSNPQYGIESWTIFSQMKIKLESTEIWLFRRMLRTPWTEPFSNNGILEKLWTKKDITLNFRKRHFKVLRHIRRKQGFENLTLTGLIEYKRDRGKLHNLLNEHA